MRGGCRAFVLGGISWGQMSKTWFEFCLENVRIFELDISGCHLR